MNLGTEPSCLHLITNKATGACQLQCVLAKSPNLPPEIIGHHRSWSFIEIDQPGQHAAMEDVGTSSVMFSTHCHVRLRQLTASLYTRFRIIFMVLKKWTCGILLGAYINNYMHIYHVCTIITTLKNSSKYVMIRYLMWPSLTTTC